MTIADCVQDTRSDLTVRNYDSLVLLGYAAFAVLVLAAIYLGPAGPGSTGSDLVTAAVNTVI